ncbi:MAG: hypothetical protein GYB68_03910 [Chloroflexi bacterium]|nr:hypothetical protein [Chloroflexota bacterium]
MERIEASVPIVLPPTWAILERELIELLNEAVDVFLAKYTRDDGSLDWDLPIPSRDGSDDFYESIYHLPLLYLLGGRDDLLERAHDHWDAITQQLTELGMLDREYEIGYDQFHQAESNLAFYYLCLADPNNPGLIDRAKRFAGFFIGDDPDASNYDPDLNIIRAPHNGSRGPRWGFVDGDPYYAVAHWPAEMAVYGLPYHDVPGIERFEDLLGNEELGRRMGEAMNERMGRGDAICNLLATSLVTNAYLITGADQYKDWVLQYVDGWIERANQNGGLLPDNVGLSGQVGEDLAGRWYGGSYGWVWPHGLYNIAQSAIVSAANAYLISQDDAYLDLPRQQLDPIISKGERRVPEPTQMSLAAHLLPQVPASQNEDGSLFLVPYRFNGESWFDYQPLLATYPTAIWNVTLNEGDWQRIEHLREQDTFDWREVLPFYAKEDAGHEAPWLRFIVGENPTYPEAILQQSIGVIYQRLEQILQDEADLSLTPPNEIPVAIHHWQEISPLTAEALVQLTLGAPAPLYNGGLLHCQVRYFDENAQRPGLPSDVAALVHQVDVDGISLSLLNLHHVESRSLILQAGAFGEHRFMSVAYSFSSDDRYPGPRGIVRVHQASVEMKTIQVNDIHFQVDLPAGHQIDLRIDMKRFINTPSYRLPWKDT